MIDPEIFKTAAPLATLAVSVIAAAAIATYRLASLERKYSQHRQAEEARVSVLSDKAAALQIDMERLKADSLRREIEYQRIAENRYVRVEEFGRLLASINARLERMETHFIKRNSVNV